MQGRSVAPPIAFAWSILVVLTLLSALNTAEKLLGLNRARRPTGREYTYVDMDFPQLLNNGNFRPAALLAETVGHYDLFDDAEWASVVPPYNGMLEMGPNKRVFALSMYHQLHCLDAIRFTYLLIRKGANVTSDRAMAAFHHSDHCFDLIRQGILCNADVTLES